MAKLIGTNIGAPIVPGQDSDTYATHSDVYGQGGYRAVQTIEERDAISYERRTVGMEVRVMSEGVVYYLESFEGDDFEGVTSQVWKVATSSPGENEAGAKEVISGVYQDGKFLVSKEEGSVPEPIDLVAGVIYLDATVGVTYHFNPETQKLEKINSLSWTDV